MIEPGEPPAESQEEHCADPQREGEEQYCTFPDSPYFVDNARTRKSLRILLEEA